MLLLKPQISQHKRWNNLCKLKKKRKSSRRSGESQGETQTVTKYSIVLQMWHDPTEGDEGKMLTKITAGYRLLSECYLFSFFSSHVYLNLCYLVDMYQVSLEWTLNTTNQVFAKKSSSSEPLNGTLLAWHKEPGQFTPDMTFSWVTFNILVNRSRGAKEIFVLLFMLRIKHSMSHHWI